MRGASIAADTPDCLPGGAHGFERCGDVAVNIISDIRTAPYRRAYHYQRSLGGALLQIFLQCFPDHLKGTFSVL